MYREILCVLGCFLAVNGFPGGFDNSMCTLLEDGIAKGHNNAPQDLATVPYKLIASTDAYTSESQVLLNLTGTDYFKGFLFQAYDTASNTLIGTFKEEPQMSSLTQCSAISHTDPNKKTSIEFVWVAPKDKSGKVFFRGTVAKGYKTFWVGVVSQLQTPTPVK